MRYREALGKDIGPIPEGLYPGDYLKSVGQKLAATYGDRYAAAPEAEWLVLFRKEAVAAMMDMIRADLALLGIRHDRSEEHTSELQSLMRISYAVFCLKNKTTQQSNRTSQL